MAWDKVMVEVSGSLADSAGDPSVRQLTYRQALHEALQTAMKKDHRVFVFGEGVDDPSGVFGTTAGLAQAFGRVRVFDTPICENTLTGIAIGAALAGLRPVLVHMRTDFLLVSMDQLANHAAKWKYMSGGNVSLPLVVRAIIGGGWGSAAQHSQPLQALFTHIPGLQVVMPATAYDAKGLLLASIAHEGPVLFIEHRWLYDHKAAVPQKPYLIPLGKACVRRQGKDLTMIADSFMVPLALEAAAALRSEGIEAEVLDLRTIKPLDYALLKESVAKTGRALVLDFGYAFCGISAEIVAFLSESCFASLKCPPIRLALPDIPTPASPVLEKLFYPKQQDIIVAAQRMCRHG